MDDVIQLHDRSICGLPETFQSVSRGILHGISFSSWLWHWRFKFGNDVVVRGATASREAAAACEVCAGILQRENLLHPNSDGLHLLVME